MRFMRNSQLSVISKVFVDTSFLVALYNKDDANHKEARKWFNLAPRHYYVTDLVMIEFLNRILYSKKLTASVSQRKALTKECYEVWTRSTAYRTCVDVDQTIKQKAEDLFFRYLDKDWSFVDCTSFVVMDMYGILEAAAFDHHFQQAGKTMCP